MTKETKSPKSKPWMFRNQVKVKYQKNRESSIIPVLWDSGADVSLIHSSFVPPYAKVTTQPRPIPVSFGSKIHHITKVASVVLCLKGSKTVVHAGIVDMCGTKELIVGRDWMYNNYFCFAGKSNDDSLLILANVPWEANKKFTLGKYAPLQPGLQLVKNSTLEVRAVSDSSFVQYRHKANKKFEELFSDNQPEKLPPHRSFDHHIELTTDEFPKPKVYPTPQKYQEALKQFIEDNLRKGFIRESSSPLASPLFFIPKPNGDLRPIIDYRGVNNITVKSQYPIPLMSAIVNQVASKNIYSSLDMKGAYNLVRVAEGDEWKCAFKTDQGLFEPLVLMYGLSGGPSTFQQYMNYVFREFIGEFMYVYLDDIIIFSQNKQEHDHHLELVRDRLKEHELYLNREKCHFYQDTVKFLGFEIKSNGVAIPQDRMIEINQLLHKRPKNRRELKRIMGLLNFVREFVPNFATIAAPINKLDRPHTKFQWTDAQDLALKKLVDLLNKAPVLKSFDSKQKTRIFTDASDVAMGAVLEQQDSESKKWHPIAFWSKQFKKHELNYHVHDKELFAILEACMRWRPYLLSIPFFELFTDHKNLQYFKTKKVLSQRQLRWSEKLEEFNFEFQFIKGTNNNKADMLSRPIGLEKSPQHTTFTPVAQKFINNEAPRSVAQILRTTLSEDPSSLYSNVKNWNHPLTDDNEIIDFKAYPVPAALVARINNNSNEKNVSISQVQVELSKIHPTERHLFEQGIKNSGIFQKVTKAINNDATFPRNFLDRAHLFKIIDGILYYGTKPCVGDSEELKSHLLSKYHDHNVTGGHSGINLTIQKLRRHYYWPGLRQYVTKYVQQCFTCQTAKPRHQKPAGLLQSLPIPNGPFDSISMDFITDLPDSDGFNAILVVVDRFSKYTIFIPTTKQVNAEELSYMVLFDVILRHGAPRSIISDRGSQFTSKLWQVINKAFDTKLLYSTAFHPQTDGQTEKMNQYLEQYLRAYINNTHNNWHSLLPFAAASINNNYNKTIKCSPNELVHGRVLNFDFNNIVAETHPTAETILNTFAANREAAKLAIEAAQKDQQRHYNKKRRDVKFKIHDQVLLSTKNLNISAVKRKFARLWIGPFTIIDIIGPNAYKLDTPLLWRGHNVFNIKSLVPFYENEIHRDLFMDTRAIDFFTNNPLRILTIDQCTKWGKTYHYRCTTLSTDNVPKSTSFTLQDLKGYEDLVSVYHDKEPAAPKPPQLATFLATS